MLKSKPEFKRPPQVSTYYDVDDVFGSASRRKYFKDLKGKLEAQESKVANVKFQKDLANSQKKSNYKAELERIRGEMNRHNTPFDAQALAQLKARETELVRMIKDISWRNI